MLASIEFLEEAVVKLTEELYFFFSWCNVIMEWQVTVIRMRYALYVLWKIEEFGISFYQNTHKMFLLLILISTLISSTDDAVVHGIKFFFLFTHM